MINALASLLAAVPAAVTNESVAHLADPPSSAPAALAGSGDVLMMVLRMTGALGFVLALVLGLAWAAKRWLPSGALRSSAAERIEILSSRTLGLRRSLVLARVRGRVLLLGATPQQIGCLSEWDDTEAWPEAAGEPGESRGHSSAIEAFRSLMALRRTAGKENAR